jgi:Tn3 transposase DDE domain
MALSLLINAITVWNTRYYQAVADQLLSMPDAIWAQVSPTSWEHIQFTGDYSFQKELALAGDLRPLRLPHGDA